MSPVVTVAQVPLSHIRLQCAYFERKKKPNQQMKKNNNSSTNQTLAQIPSSWLKGLMELCPRNLHLAMMEQPCPEVMSLWIPVAEEWNRREVLLPLLSVFMPSQEHPACHCVIQTRWSQQCWSYVYNIRITYCALVYKKIWRIPKSSFYFIHFILEAFHS